jgi:3-carboxy-cis,cis-muconate cycloisomerase
MASLAGAAALAAGSCAKICGDVALLMQAEVAEAFEPAADGRGGSSTLPHKRNPVGAAAVGAAARRVTALVPVFYEALAGEHERALVGWPAEWQSLGELMALAGGAVARTAETVTSLEVDPAAMAARVERMAGALTTERVALELAPRLGRAEGRRAVAEASNRASGPGGAELAAELLADQSVAAVVGAEELAGLLDPSAYLGATDVWIDRTLARFEEKKG